MLKKHESVIYDCRTASIATSQAEDSTGAKCCLDRAVAGVECLDLLTTAAIYDQYGRSIRRNRNIKRTLQAGDRHARRSQIAAAIDRELNDGSPCSGYHPQITSRWRSRHPFWCCPSRIGL